MTDLNSAQNNEEMKDLQETKIDNDAAVKEDNEILTNNEETKTEETVKTNETVTSGKKNDALRFYLRIVIPLLLISAVIALLMALVNGFTKDKIASNNLKATEEAIARIYPKFDLTTEIESDIELPIKAVYRLDEGGALLGYCVSVQPSGFNGAIEMMVGINPDGTITGVEIISHTETPGIGAAADDPEYLKDYIGLSGNISFGDGIDALTGATISSKAILSGVNAAVEAVNIISGQTAEGGAQ
ncbi:MAG: RnfABCDGE type electron transport complex subunit G [Eubacteriales bacterium]|jgi:electron transport complex protein RnfG